SSRPPVPEASWPLHLASRRDEWSVIRPATLHKTVHYASRQCRVRRLHSGNLFSSHSWHQPCRRPAAFVRDFLVTERREISNSTLPYNLSPHRIPAASRRAGVQCTRLKYGMVLTWQRQKQSTTTC